MENSLSNKVIRLAEHLGESEADSSKTPRRRRQPRTRVIAITSGKGGVGKTNVVANLGYNLGRMGKKVLVLDADLGLGNLDVLLGLAPKYNLSHVMSGERRISEIVLQGPGKMQILPAASGIQEMTRLSHQNKVRLLKELDTLVADVDFLLVDTAAGISSNVMYFTVTAQEILVVVTPEPTSITDAYALMKVLSVKYKARDFKLLVNMAADAQEAREVFRQLSLVTDRFLDVSIEYVGHILSDPQIRKGVRQQKVVSDLFPTTDASRCFATLAGRIVAGTLSRFTEKNSHFFWDDLLRNQFE